MSDKRKSSDPSSKRRRGLGVVTPNACTECRKKRAKCDGQTPCARCAVQKGAECVYEIPIRQSKENMRNEIENLRSQQKQADRILSALVTDDKAEQVIHDLRHGATIEAIAEKLGGGPPLPSSAKAEEPMTISTQLGEDTYDRYQGPWEGTDSTGISPSSRSEQSTGITLAQDTWTHAKTTTFVPEQGEAMQWTPIFPKTTRQDSFPSIESSIAHTGSQVSDTVREARTYGQDIIFGPDFKMEEQMPKRDPNNKFSWTNVTNDVVYSEHLLALYFCWEYPTFASLSKEHFLGDYRRGRTKYCSSLLVNAILSIGCRFSNDASSQFDLSDPNSTGEQFFIEAQRLLEAQETQHTVTTVQAMGLMALHQASHGRPSQSVFLAGQSIRLAIEMGLHIDRKDHNIEETVRSATFWGAYSLDQAWSHCIGRLPQFSKMTTTVAKPPVLPRLEASAWVPYTDDGAPLSRTFTQPSNVRSVYRNFCELSELIHDSLYALYNPGVPITCRKLIEVYNPYITWYDSIPAALRLGQNSTPTVLFAHMHYHFAILLLFRPFIKFNLSHSLVSPHDVCLQASDAISVLVRSYSDLYSLRRTPSLAPYIVMTSSIMHIYYWGNETEIAAKEERTAKILQGWRDLGEMSSSHGFAGRGRKILSFLVKRWNLDLSLDDDDIEASMEVNEDGRPRSISLNLFCVGLESGWLMKGIGKTSQGLDATQEMEIDSAVGSLMEEENSLFGPFLLQGLPLMATGRKDLQEAGFGIRA